MADYHYLSAGVLRRGYSERPITCADAGWVQEVTSAIELRNARFAGIRRRSASMGQPILTEICTLFPRMCTDGDNHQWNMTEVGETADRTLAEWTFCFTASRAVRGGAGRTLRFFGVSLFEPTDGALGWLRRAYEHNRGRRSTLPPPKAGTAGWISRAAGVRPPIRVALPMMERRV